MSLVVLIYAIQENIPAINYIFFSWIIIGFLYAEILEILGKYKEPEEEH
ncbi:hypothetical protein SUSAZ_09815 [Sulfolobus acidocaldarius SUSAZ]|nr:hypothetical protein SUSAZ_09815 [Sulfolobus acidocaldarius SUSAZ]